MMDMLWDIPGDDAELHWPNDERDLMMISYSWRRAAASLKLFPETDLGLGRAVTRDLCSGARTPTLLPYKVSDYQDLLCRQASIAYDICTLFKSPMIQY